MPSKTSEPLPTVPSCQVNCAVPPDGVTVPAKAPSTYQTNRVASPEIVAVKEIDLVEGSVINGGVASGQDFPVGARQLTAGPSSPSERSSATARAFWLPRVPDHLTSTITRL